MDEDQILIGLKAGEERAFNALFDLLYAQVRFYIEHITEDTNESEDITMQSLLKFWEKGAADFDSITAIKSFVFTVARNAAYNHLKKSRIHQLHKRNISHTSTTTEEIYTDEALYKVEMLQVLYDEIEKLPLQMKEVLKMVYIDDVPRNVVAEKLGITVNTVNNHCAAARNKLRQIFSERQLIVLLILLRLSLNYSNPPFL
jgi:RNA polymerase sigma factor (sigma-70 family)